MKHELLIEVTPGAGDWARLDTGGETPAMVFQVNDLNDLKDRQASYSQELELPVSAHNCRVFGFANEFSARSVSPYRIHRCMWYADGIDVLGLNFRLELQGLKGDFFSCQIVSNLTGLFETLQNKAVGDLALDPLLWSERNIRGMLTSVAPTDLYAWAFPITTQSKPGTYGRLLNGSEYFFAAEVMPYFKLLPLVHEILGQAGYTLDTDVESVPGYVPDLLSMADLKPGSAGANISMDSMGPLQQGARSSVYIPTAQLANPVYLLSDVYASSFKYGEIRVITGIPDPDVEGMLTTGYEYCAPGYMKMRVQLDCVSNEFTDNFARVRYRIQKIGSADIAVGDINPDVNRTVIVSFDTGVSGQLTSRPFVSDIIELSPGDRIYCEVILTKIKDTTTQYYGSMNVQVPYNENAVPAGGYIYPHLSTDFKSQLDIVKLFVQLYGLFVSVDEQDKVVRAYSMNRVVDRARSGDYTDWSGKIDSKEITETTFRAGSYERVNRILLNNNELLSTQKSGVINVDNDNLLPAKDLFTLAAETAVNGNITVMNYMGGGTPQPADMDIRYTSDDGKWFMFQSWGGSGFTPGPGIPHVKYRASKTHIVQLQPVASVTASSYVLITMLPPGGINNTPNGTIGGSYCYVPVAVDPQYYVDTYYSLLESAVLNPARVIEASFNLTPADIMNLDMLRPVYISRYGSFFYIQKINNYGARKLTKVTLVALNLNNE